MRIQRVRIQPPAAEPHCRPAAVAIDADDFALLDLRSHGLGAEAVVHQRLDVSALFFDMVELEDPRVVLAAVDTRVGSQVLLDELSCDRAATLPCSPRLLQVQLAT